MIMCLTVQIINLASDAEGNEPDANPEKKNVGKFVLIKADDRLNMIYGPIDEYSYHAELVKRYCDRNSIPSGWLKKPDLYEIYGNSHQIRGGGWLEENPGEKQLRIFGYSTAYGRFDREDMLYLSRHATEFAGLEISIED